MKLSIVVFAAAGSAGRGVAVFGAANHRRMWSSTAAVGQQSTFRPFFF